MVHLFGIVEQSSQIICISGRAVTPAHEFEIAKALVDPAIREVFVFTTTQTSVPRERGAAANKTRDDDSWRLDA